MKIFDRIQPASVAKWIAITTASLSLFTAFIDSFGTTFMSFFETMTYYKTQTFLSLNSWVFSYFYLWQLVTYPFIEFNYAPTLSLMYLINVAFSSLLLWILLKAVGDRIGTKELLWLFWGSTFMGGVVALSLIAFSYGFHFLAGPVVPLIALGTAWALFEPQLEILLFWILPISLKWLVTGTLGGLFLVSISQADFIAFFAYVASLIWGYAYTIRSFGISSPFAWTARLDAILRKKSKTVPKVVPLYSESKHLDQDEHFVDAMLSKISKEGESALTRQERKRLEEISLKKKNQR